MGHPGRGYNVNTARSCVPDNLVVEGFGEKTCAVCGEPFKSGESLVLFAKGIHEDLGTLTIPIHDRCKNKTASIEMEIPDTEEKYRLKEDGTAEKYFAVKTLEQKGVL